MTDHEQSESALVGSAMKAQSLAILMLCLAFFVFTAFQTTLLLSARGNLATVHSNQEAPLAESLRLRQNAEELARRTAVLAEQGNVSASAIVAEFRRQGVDMRATGQ